MTDLLQRLTNDLSSFYWWISVVIVGIAINIASAYLKTPLDKVLDKWSGERQRRTASKSIIRKRKAAAIANNQTLLALTIRSESIRMFSAMILLTGASIMVGMGVWLEQMKSDDTKVFALRIAMALTALAMYTLALRSMRRALNTAELLSEVTNHLKRESAQINTEQAGITRT